MKKYNIREKKEHAPGCACSICGNNYNSFSFKKGFICESCIDYIKNISIPDSDQSKPDK